MMVLAENGLTVRRIFAKKQVVQTKSFLYTCALKQDVMKCRIKCGACCIAPSISSPIPGMPNGKPAGVPCIHLNEDFSCAIFHSPDRPKVCAGFKAEPLVCGNNREQALEILSELEAVPEGL